MIFIRSLKTIQNEENLFQDPRHCKTEERLKKEENCNIRTRDNIPYCLMRPAHGVLEGSVDCLFFKLF